LNDRGIVPLPSPGQITKTELWGTVVQAFGLSLMTQDPNSPKLAALY